MSSIEKLIGRLRNARGTVSFRDIKRVAEHFGYRLDRVPGSHHIFVAQGRNHVNIPVHQNKVKVVYVRKLFKELGIE
ncbi:MAG: type II toxin-antitoxin system HicA family toxin [Bacteroidota bacterium]